VSSQSSVILDDEEKTEDAVIDEQSIHQVVSTSQSFTEDRDVELNPSQNGKHQNLRLFSISHSVRMVPICFMVLSDISQPPMKSNTI